MAFIGLNALEIAAVGSIPESNQPRSNRHVGRRCQKVSRSAGGAENYQRHLERRHHVLGLSQPPRSAKGMLFQSYLDGPLLPVEGAQVPEVIRMCLLRRTPCSVLRCHAGRQLKARYPGGDSAVCVDRGLLI